MKQGKRIRLTNSKTPFKTQEFTETDSFELLLGKTPGPKVPKGYCLLNMAKWKQNELRALADCCKMELRLFLYLAAIHFQRHLEKELGIKTGDAVKMSRQQRHAIAQRREVMASRIKCQADRILRSN